MPEYAMQSPSGEVRDFFYPMREAPSIGETVEIDGQTWTRLPSAAHIGVEPARSRYPIESISLPPTVPGCKISKNGRPIIRSQEHARQIADTHGLSLAE